MYQEESPCHDHGCEEKQRQALAYALEAPGEWERWLAMRRTCRVGREHEYSEIQTRYHYTKDRGILRDLIAETGCGEGGGAERSPVI